MRNIITLALLLLVTSAFAQQKEVLLINKKFSASSFDQLDVATTGGSIRVTGDAGKEASVEVILRPNGNARNAGTDLKKLFEEQYDLELGVQNNKLIAKAKRKSTRGNNPLSVSFVVSVPRKTNTELKTSGGSIALSNLEGNQQFTTSGGSLSIEKVTGNITGTTSGGSIAASDSRGKLALTTSGGSISASNITGDLKAHTSGGSIKLDNTEGTVDASTSGGSITASLNKVTNAVQLRTSGGSVRITLPKGGYNLDLKGTRVNVDKLDNFSGSTKRDALVGTVNGGGHAIAASTSGGTVNLSWQ